MSHWFYLGIAILSEIAGTTALKFTEGYTRPGPTAVVVIAYGVAFYFLSLTLRFIPVGIAYAIWSGVGVLLVTAIGWLVYGQQADAAAIAGRLRSYEDPAASLGDGDDLAAMLHETYLELSRQPLFPSLAAPWRQALRDHLHGHLQEHGWRSDYRQNPASLPSYADYLAVGCHTIGFPLIPWTFLIAFSDPTAPAHLAGLEEMAVTAGVCLRLANDIRSYERELAEGKINAIVILSWTAVAEAAQRQAEEHIVAEIEAGLASLRRQRQALAASCDLPSAAILGMAETGCRFYHRRDFHVAA